MNYRLQLTERILEEYPKDVRLRDGTFITVRPLEPQDLEGLLHFFQSLSEEDRLYLKEDVTNQEVVARLVADLNYRRSLPLLAFHQDLIIAYASLEMPRRAWSKHVVELNGVVLDAYKKRGLSSVLVKELVDLAKRQGYDLILCPIMDTQEAARKSLVRLGFRKEATLRNFAMDSKGVKHNLFFMTNDIEELWRNMADMLSKMEEKDPEG